MKELSCTIRVPNSTNQLLFFQQLKHLQHLDLILVEKWHLSLIEALFQARTIKQFRLLYHSEDLKGSFNLNNLKYLPSNSQLLSLHISARRMSTLNDASTLAHFNNLIRCS